MTQLVDTRTEGRVCVLTLRREAKLDALSTVLEGALAAALASAEVRDAACVVVTGARRAFSAGADVSELGDRSPADIAAYYAATGDVYERLGALAARPPLAASVTKRAIDAAAESSHAAGIMLERLAYAMLAQTEDARGDA